MLQLVFIRALLGACICKEASAALDEVVSVLDYRHHGRSYRPAGCSRYFTLIRNLCKQLYKSHIDNDIRFKRLQ